MTFSCRQRLHLSILVIVAMVWSQFALVLHASVCVESAAATTAIVTDDGHDAASGHAQPGGADTATCSTHCQNDQSDATGRVPVPPALPLAPMIALCALEDMREIIRLAIDEPASSSWNRPTPHPANILLI